MNAHESGKTRQSVSANGCCNTHWRVHIVSLCLITFTLLNIATLFGIRVQKYQRVNIVWRQTRCSAADDISRQREHTLWRCGRRPIAGIARYLRAASHKCSADRQGESKLNPIPVQCVDGPNSKFKQCARI